MSDTEDLRAELAALRAERDALLAERDALLAERERTAPDNLVPLGIGTPGLRDPQAPCDHYAPGAASGDCQTDGHYLCAKCSRREGSAEHDGGTK